MGSEMCIRDRLIFGPDSKSIYSDYGHYLFRRSYVTGKKVWSGKVEHSSLWVRSIALSKDGSLLAAGRNGGRVDLYETDDASGEASHQFQGSLRNRWLEFSPDASILAIPQGTPAHKVDLVNPRSGKKLRSLDTGNHYVVDVAFSPDGKRLLTGGLLSLIHI